MSVLRKDLIYPKNLLFDVFGEEIDVPQDIDEALEVVFGSLTERERGMLIQRYKGCHTYEEIGKTYNLTRDRIRQIINRALRKLRHPSRARWLQYGYRKTEILDKQAKEQAAKAQKEKDRKLEEITEKKAKELEYLDLSVRSFNVLKRAGLNTVGDVIDYGLENLHLIRNMGKHGIEEIKKKIFEQMRSDEEQLNICGYCTLSETGTLTTACFTSHEVDYSVEIQIVDNELVVAERYDNGEIRKVLELPISFCPFCGKRLGE